MFYQQGIALVLQNHYFANIFFAKRNIKAKGRCSALQRSQKQKLLVRSSGEVNQQADVVIQTYNNYQSRMHVDQTKKIVGEYSFFIRDKLGRGSSSQVFRGFSLKSSEPVAVKVIPLPAADRDAVASSAEAQIQQLKKFRECANIIQLKNAIQTKNNLYIVTELCEGGTLEAQLATSRRLDEENAIKIMEQVVAGCKEFIRKGVIHRDLKPTNIFLKGPHYKIGDLGFAVDAEQCKAALSENVGSPSYMPIESLMQNKYSHQGDIWALGIIFFQMLTGRTPWKARTEKELLKQMQNFKLGEVLPKLISTSSKKFLQRTLVVDVANRMTIEQFMQWSFKSSEEEKDSSSAKFKLNLQKPLRSTYDLHQMANLKEMMSNKSQATLKPVTESPKNTSFGEQARCFKVKNPTESPVVFAKKRVSTLKTMNTITQGLELDSYPKDFSMSPNKTPKETRSNSPRTSIMSKEIQTPNARNKAESFSTMQKFFNTSKDLPQPFQGLVSQVQSQVNYARFLLRILRKLNDSLRTKDSRILQLKESLLYFLYIKLAEIKDLRFAKAISSQKQDFLASPHYASVLALLAKYRERARQEGAKLSIGIKTRTERQFLGTLGGAMGYLYSHLAPVRDNGAELMRKRTVVSILEDLIALSDLFMLDRQENWIKFKDQSGISGQLAKTVPEAVSPAYFKAVEASFLRLAQS